MTDANSVDPVQTALSDQGLHCLLFQILLKEKTIQKQFLGKYVWCKVFEILEYLPFAIYNIENIPLIRPLSDSPNPASILYKPIAGRYRPVSYPDGPITARYRFIKNAYWEMWS